MSMRLTILGCGSSTGVPKVGGDWGACNPANPKNRRRRCSALVEKVTPSGKTVALIDTSPDLREQCLDANVTYLDGVVYTHDHADHTHGIDDLRMLAYSRRRRIDVHADRRTLEFLKLRFDYCFETQPGSSYPPIVTGLEIPDGHAVKIEGAGGPIDFSTFRQHHGDIDSLGFRIGHLAYSSDLNDLPDASLPLLEGLDVWVINTLRYTDHPTHLTLEKALWWIERMRPKRAVLTHLHVDLDYDELSSRLPSHVVPAHDGLTIDFD